MTDLPKPGDIDGMESLIRSILPDGARIAGYDDSEPEAVVVECHGRKCTVSIYGVDAGWEASVVWSVAEHHAESIESLEDLRSIIG